MRTKHTLCVFLGCFPVQDTAVLTLGYALASTWWGAVYWNSTGLLLPSLTLNVPLTLHFFHSLTVHRNLFKYMHLAWSNKREERMNPKDTFIPSFTTSSYGILRVCGLLWNLDYFPEMERYILTLSKVFWPFRVKIL